MHKDKKIKIFDKYLFLKDIWQIFVAQRYLTNICCTKIFDKYLLQYPDSPDFVPSPYGPPEPVKQGERKFKRQSRPVVVIDDSNRFNMWTNIENQSADQDQACHQSRLKTDHLQALQPEGAKKSWRGETQSDPCHQSFQALVQVSLGFVSKFCLRPCPHFLRDPF